MPVKLRHAINCQLYFNFKDVKICVYVYIHIPLFIRLSFYLLECPTGLFTSSVSRLQSSKCSATWFIWDYLAPCSV